MRKVSEESQAILTQLVAWEVLGVKEIDPKSVLRQTPLHDLSIISSNIKKQGHALKNFVCISMVEAELLYKSGLLQKDWSYEMEGTKVRLSFAPLSFPSTSMALPLLQIGAEA